MNTAHTSNQFRRSFVTLFILLALLVLLAAAYRYNRAVGDQKAILKADGSISVLTGGRAIERSLGETVGYVLYLAANPALIAAAGQTADKKNMENLRRNFSLFSMTHPVFHQLCWLDKDGMEVLRISNIDGQIGIADQSKLENKRDQRYFQNSIQLRPGEIYVSPLSLEVENTIVLTPRLPIIRIATPVIDSLARRQGTLVVTVAAKEFLAHVETGKNASNSRNMLLNKDGYWLKSDNPDDEWGFMFNRHKTLAASSPAAWKKIVSADHGQFEDSSGLWSFETISLLKPKPEDASSRASASGDQHFWKIVSYVPENRIAELNSRVMRSTALYSAGTLLLLLAGSWYFTKMRYSKLQAQQELGIASTEYAKQLAICDAEARMYAILHTLADGIITFSEDGIIEEFAANAERLFGYFSYEAIGQNIGILIS